MCNDNEQAVLCQRVQGFEQPVLRFRVEGRGGFVENQNPGVSDQTACNTEPLLLPHGKRITRPAENGVDALGHLVNKVAAPGHGQCGNDLGVARVRVCEQQVIPDALSQQQVLLKDVGDVAADAVNVQFIHVTPVKQHAASRGFQKTG